MVNDTWNLRSVIRRIEHEIREIMSKYPQIPFERAFDIFALNLIDESIDIDEAFELTAIDGPQDNGIDALKIDDPR